MSDTHGKAPAADPAKSAADTVGNAIKEAAAHTKSKLFDRLSNAAIAIGEDILWQIFGHPTLDRILGRTHINQANAHAEEGDYEKAYNTLHQHIREKRRRFGKANLRAQRRLISVEQGAEFHKWMAKLQPHERREVHRYFEAYLDEDLQVTDLAVFIKMTPDQRMNFLAAEHEHGLADILREKNPAIVADNNRLDREHEATWDRIWSNRNRPQPRAGFWRWLFRKR